MMKMKMTLVLQRYKGALFIELFVLFSWLYSFEIFINLQIAVLSSFLVILLSAYAQKKMVQRSLQAGVITDDRDVIDTIEDPHGLYEEDKQESQKDFKEIIKEEKKRIKIFSKENWQTGLKSSFALYRLSGYLFLVLGFIALKNNQLLDITSYLVGLFLGVVMAVGVFRGGKDA